MIPPYYGGVHHHHHIHHICGFFYIEPTTNTRKYLPQVKLSAHATILATTSRTTLTQTFTNPADSLIKELRYVFPLYDGVSVVSFTCTIGKRVIKGVVKEKDKARETFKAAVARGETAGLLEQASDASDVFTTTVGNIPAGETIKVELVYLGELKHDAEVDGIRFTIPTKIAPRYGQYPGEMLKSSSVKTDGGITITVDAEMPIGSAIRSIQSPSHPISVSIGTTSVAPTAEPSLQKASATLSLGSTELEKDFVLQVIATNTSNPVAILETHPTIPNQRALMATLVPKFSLPPSRPEVVFICDRSGSMGGKIPNLISALQIFLKSLPVGVKFNICSFGNRHSFLWAKSKSYSASTLEEAMGHVEAFQANFGGTEMYRPVEETIKQRYADMDLEIFLLTDGEIWDQDRLFQLVNKSVEESKGAVRVFTLGVGRDVSHALIEGVARAGNGFSQSVGDDEKMEGKVVRMLRGALSPHVKDYSLSIKYEASKNAPSQEADDDDDDFELIEKVMDALVINVPDEQTAPAAEQKKPISLFDPTADPDVQMKEAPDVDKFSHLQELPAPKYLQTPTSIPPLFPFSRTSVYILLSDAAPHGKTPKSVILSGTSAHGPLELEIPITILADKGETVHQLAARKAILELEEGRGWIFGAKDKEGKLLKEKCEGRFEEMIEREGVRLGTQFQVGGKWCSFVAVEDGEKGSESELETQVAGGEGEKISSVDSRNRYNPQVQYRMSASHAPPFGRAHGGYATTMVSPASPQYSPVSDSEQDLFAEEYRARNEPLKPLDPASILFLDFPADPTPCEQAQPLGFAPGAFGSGQQGAMRSRGGPMMQQQQMQRAPAMAMAMPASYGAAPDRVFESAAPKPMAKKMRKMAAPADSVSTRDSAPGSAASAKVAQSTPPGGPEEPLTVLVSLQSFSGSWTWTPRLESVLGITKDEAKTRARATGSSWAKELSDDELATVCAIVFMRSKLASQRQTWDMVGEKADQWLEERVRSLGTAVEDVKGVVVTWF